MAFDATAMTEREVYFTTLPDVEPPAWYSHNPPARPAEPDISELDDAGIAAAYATHEREMAAWRTSNALARRTQYRWSLADAAIDNKPVTTTSSSGDDDPGDPPPAYVPPHVGDPPIVPP